MVDELSLVDRFGRAMWIVFKREGEKVVKSKPDLLVVLAIVLGVGIIASSYTQSQPDPEIVANQFSIR